MRALLAIALFVIGVGLLWGAGEWHYENCLDKARSAYPIVVSKPPAGGSEQFEGERPRDWNAANRRTALDGCSRVPW